MLHLSSYEPIHIAISNTTLWAILRRFGQADVPNDKEFRDNSRYWWDLLFKLKKAEGNNRRVKFKEFIKTDGVSVSIRVIKPARECNAAVLPSVEELSNYRVIGVGSTASS